MGYQLQALTIQQTNWPVFISLYTELFDVSPTRELDKKNIKLDKPTAYQECLKENFGTGYHDAQINLSLIGTANADMLLEIQNKTMLHLISKESTVERGLFIFIVTGNLGEWRHSTLVLADGSRNIREFNTKCQSFIKMAGYKI